MMRYKYIGSDEHYPELTNGEVYDVTKYIPDGVKGHYDTIFLIINNDVQRYYVSDAYYKPIFKDVTRNEVIDGILK